MFDIGLFVFLLLSPILLLRIGNLSALQFFQFNSIGNDNNVLQLQFFYYGVIALFILSLFSKVQREINLKIAGYFLALCFVHIFLHPKSYPYFLNIFFGVLLFVLAVRYAKNIKISLYAILFVATLNTVFAILQTFGIFLINNSVQGRIDGLMCISNHLGFYQALAVPICYFLNPYLALIPLIGLILSKSYISLIACIIWMVFLLKDKIKKKFLIGGSLITFIYFIFNFQAILGKLRPRLCVWDYALNKISENILLGYGFGNFYLYDDKFGGTSNPYNIYLSILYCLGILGFICICYYFLDVPIKVLKDKTINLLKILLVSVLIILLMGLGHSFMDFPRLAGTIIVLLALYTIETRGIICG